MLKFLHQLTPTLSLEEHDKLYGRQASIFSYPSTPPPSLTSSLPPHQLRAPAKNPASIVANSASSNNSVGVSSGVPKYYPPAYRNQQLQQPSQQQRQSFQSIPFSRGNELQEPIATASVPFVLPTFSLPNLKTEADESAKSTAEAVQVSEPPAPPSPFSSLSHASFESFAQSDDGLP